MAAYRDNALDSGLSQMSKIVLKKSLLADERRFLGPLMRLVRGGRSDIK